MRVDEDIWVGAVIMTPFGRAIISDIDMARDRIVTNLGTWDMQQIFRREAPECGTGPNAVEEHAKAMQAWLEGPAHEARGEFDTKTEACSCTRPGMGVCCQTQTYIHKRSGGIVQTRHIALGGCGCSERTCACLQTKTS